MREMLELTDKNFKTAMKNASGNNYDLNTLKIESLSKETESISREIENIKKNQWKT